MGALMFAGPKLEQSPYSHLLDDALWHEISDMFVKDACALMGLSIESPLTVAVNAGATALPSLLNIKQASINLCTPRITSVTRAESFTLYRVTSASCAAGFHDNCTPRATRATCVTCATCTTCTANSAPNNAPNLGPDNCTPRATCATCATCNAVISNCTPRATCTTCTANSAPNNAPNLGPDGLPVRGYLNCLAYVASRMGIRDGTIT